MAKMKKQGTSDRTNEKQGMEIKGLKDKMKKGKRKANPWMAHVKKTRAKMKGKSLKEVLIAAKKTYKKK